MFVALLLVEMSLRRAVASWPPWFTVLFVAAGYYAVARVTVTQLFLVDWDVVPVWPAAGWAVAAAVCFKGRGLIGVLLGLMILDWSRFDGVALFVILAGVSLETLLGARLIMHLGKESHVWLSRVRDLPLLAAVAAVSSTLSATFGVSGMCLSGTVAWSAFLPTWLVYWLGDSLGILFITPVALNLLAAKIRMTPPKLVELVVLLLVTLTLSHAIFSGWFPAAESALAAFFPLLIWASLRFGPLGGSSVSLLISALALWGTARGTGPLAHGNLYHQIGVLWTFLGVVLVTTYLFAAILEERRRAQSQIAEREFLLRSFYDGSPVMMGIVETRDDDLVFVSCNAALAAFFDRAVESIQGRPGKELGRLGEHMTLWLDKCRQSQSEHRSIRFEYSRASEHGKQTLAATVCAIAGGAAPRFSFVLQDVSERARARRELDRFFTLSLDMLCIAGLDGFFKRVNPAFTATLGLPRRELVSRPFVDFVHPDDRESTLRELTRLGSGARMIDFEHRFRCADGSYRWLSWTAMAEPEEGLIYATARDVSDARTAAEDLRIAKERAEAATEAKSEFLANMSHELRTPLSAIIGMSELIEQTELDSEQREYVNGIRHSGKALLHLVNDLLDFAKIESGKLELESTRFELESLVSTALNPLAYEAHRKGLELVFRIAPDVPNELLGDPTRLQQVLVNLVSNAVKFTETGYVEIDVTAQHRSAEVLELQVRVEDTGVGIPRHRQADIFESFVQADGTITRKHGGTGLGLTICARLVSLMGGDIRVESEVGCGSTFCFTADVEISPEASEPRATSDPGHAPVDVLVVDSSPRVRQALVSTLEANGIRAVGADAGDEALSAVRQARENGRSFQVALVAYSCFGDGSASWIRTLRTDRLHFLLLTRTTDRLAEDYRSELGVYGRLVKPVAPRHLLRALAILASESPHEKEPVTGTFARETRRPLRILVADDDTMNRMVARKLLTNVGHQVVSAQNGREALESMKNERFDLVFMDLQMPEMGGLDVALRIRARETARGERRTPIVAVTANTRKEDRDRCLRSGMDGYLAKPFEPARLLAVADRFVSSVGVPSESGGDAPPAVDISELEALVQGDQNVLHQVIEVFLQETPAVVARIEASIDASDWKSVARDAHRLKGSLMTLGARSAAATAYRMEEAAGENRGDESVRAWLQLEGELSVVMNELDKFTRQAIRCDVPSRS